MKESVVPADRKLPLNLFGPIGLAGAAWRLRVKLVILKKGGEPVEVAVNPALITDVRSTAGPFTEIYFSEHRVTVEGTFRQVVEKLSGGESASAASGQTVRSWISTAKA